MKRIFIITVLFGIILNSYAQTTLKRDIVKAEEELEVRDTNIIDLIIEHAPSGTAREAANGLAIDGNNVVLGDTLDRETTIDGAGYNLYLGQVLSKILNLYINVSDDFVVNADDEIQFSAGGVQYIWDGAYWINQSTNDTLATKSDVETLIAADAAYLPLQFQYIYSTSTTDSRPGATFFRFNNATPASVTQIYVDDFDVNTVDRSSSIDLMDTGSYWMVYESNTIYANYQVTGGIIDGSGYTKLTVTYQNGAGSFTGLATLKHTLDISNSVAEFTGIDSLYHSDSETWITDTIPRADSNRSEITVYDTLRFDYAKSYLGDMTIDADGNNLTMDADSIKIIANEASIGNTTLDSTSVKADSSEFGYIKVGNTILDTSSVKTDTARIGNSKIYAHSYSGLRITTNTDVPPVSYLQLDGEGTLLSSNNGEIDIESSNNRVRIQSTSGGNSHVDVNNGDVIFTSSTDTITFDNDTVFAEEEALKVGYIKVGNTVIDSTSMTSDSITAEEYFRVGNSFGDIFSLNEVEFTGFKSGANGFMYPQQNFQLGGSSTYNFKTFEFPFIDITGEDSTRIVNDKIILRSDKSFPTVYEIAFEDDTLHADSITAKLKAYSVGGGDVRSTSDTTNAKTWFQEQELDSISVAKIKSPNDSIIIDSRIVTNQYIGQLYVAGDSTLSIGAAGTYYTFAKFVQDIEVNTTLTDSTITALAPGYYSISDNASYTHGTNSTIVHHSIFINDIEYEQIEAERKIGTGGDVGNSGNAGIVWLNTNDVVKVKFKADNTGTITVGHFNFHLFRL